MCIYIMKPHKTSSYTNLKVALCLARMCCLSLELIGSRSATYQFINNITFSTSAYKMPAGSSLNWLVMYLRGLQVCSSLWSCIFFSVILFLFIFFGVNFKFDVLLIYWCMEFDWISTKQSYSQARESPSIWGSLTSLAYDHCDEIWSYHNTSVAIMIEIPS